MVVVDNNVLRSLAKIQRLDFLPQIFDGVGTVSSVFDELHQDEVAGYEFVERIDVVKAYQGGWLEVRSITESELQLADDIADSTLAFTDAESIAVASNRDERLLTDDGYVGEMAAQRGVEVWDLKLLLEAALMKNLISTESELSTVVDALREQDGYRFSAEDRRDLFDRL